MRPKRIALQLAMAGAAAISLLAGIAQPAMASTGPTTTGGITALTPPSCLIYTVEDVVIGTTFKVYHDAGAGWQVLQNGAVLQSTNPTTISKMGVKIAVLGLNASNMVTYLKISVLGTTGHYYCNFKLSGDSWTGWHTTGCPQQY